MPRYLLLVLALGGYSTMSWCLNIGWGFRVGAAGQRARGSQKPTPGAVAPGVQLVSFLQWNHGGGRGVKVSFSLPSLEGSGWDRVRVAVAPLPS